MQDTFRGRLCECPVVKGVKFVGDGYTHCEGKKVTFLLLDSIKPPGMSLV